MSESVSNSESESDSETAAEVQIRAAGDSNSQVTEPVKDCIYSWLEDRGVTDARETVVLYHRRSGDYVAIENRGVSDIQAFNIEAYKEAVRDDEDAGKYSYWRNQNKTDDIFWVHRQWVEDRMEESGEFADG